MPKSLLSKVLRLSGLQSRVVTLPYNLVTTLYTFRVIYNSSILIHTRDVLTYMYYNITTCLSNSSFSGTSLVVAFVVRVARVFSRMLLTISYHAHSCNKHDLVHSIMT